MGVREEFGQLSWYAKQYRSANRIRRQLRVNRDLDFPQIRKSRRIHGTVWGVSVVRNELDILPHSIDHFFSQGVDQLLIADNRSNDGTREYLQDMSSANPRIHLVLDSQRAHWQSEKITRLAFAAWRAGADWVIPFDADEFWFAPGSTLADWLGRQTASLIHADFHHMVPASGTQRSIVESDFFMDVRPSFPGKVAVRSHPFLEIGPGNHLASRVGPVMRGLHIAHAQYRSPEQVARKVRQGTEAARLTGEDLSWFSPHWEKGSQLTDREVGDVWARLTQGESDARLGFQFQEPRRIARPLQWKWWNSDGSI